MTNAERLAAFIREHDCQAQVNADGSIFATCRATQNGVVFDETTRLPATIKAVRDWLGY